MINCASCRWWDEIGKGFGYCALAQSLDDHPKYSSTLALAHVEGGKGVAQLITDHRFTCSQFSKAKGRPAPAGSHPPSVESVPSVENSGS
jgi:hypothetical protein